MKYYLFNVLTNTYEQSFVDYDDMLAFLSEYNIYSNNFQNSNKIFNKKFWSDFGWRNSRFKNEDVYNDFIGKALSTSYKNAKCYTILGLDSIYWEHYLIIIDAKGIIFNPYSYKEEILAEIKRERVTKKNKKRTSCKYEYRKDPVPFTGQFFSKKLLREINTGHIIREEYNEEYEEYIRPKYRNQFYKHEWLEKSRCYSKSWKDCTKKRKQWM